MTKSWKEIKSLNFRLHPTVEMIKGTITKIYQACPTRTNLPTALRPREIYVFDDEYAFEFFKYLFARIGVRLDDASFYALCNAIKNDTFVDPVSLVFDTTQGFVDDFSNEEKYRKALIAIGVIIHDRHQCMENPDSARNAKAYSLIQSLLDLLPEDINRESKDTLMKRKVGRL